MVVVLIRDYAAMFFRGLLDLNAVSSPGQAAPLLKDTL